MAVREQGTVKWFNNVRGYGFITRGENSDDIFVHYRNIKSEGYRSLTEGQKVEFELQQGEKGLQAEEVVPL
ncbi:MAG: cold-shock protein [Cellvibrio sp.]